MVPKMAIDHAGAEGGRFTVFVGKSGSWWMRTRKAA
jgi:hypothetical protein